MSWADKLVSWFPSLAGAGSPHFYTGSSYYAWADNKPAHPVEYWCGQSVARGWSDDSPSVQACLLRWVAEQEHRRLHPPTPYIDTHEVWNLHNARCGNCGETLKAIHAGRLRCTKQTPA